MPPTLTPPTCNLLTQPNVSLARSIGRALLTLNLERAAAQGGAVIAAPADETDD
jgi:hypothetical protein